MTAIGALVFTGLSLNATQQQIEVAAQGQYTDRYTKAVEQIGQQGPDRLQVRLGGIYALERLTRDSSRDQPTIIEVLSAFIRANNRAPLYPDTCPTSPAIDTQAALTVLVRRDATYDNGARINVAGSCLSGANLRGADLRGADLFGADLSEADLSRAKLNGADLRNTDLRFANLRDANVSGADLRSARLHGADLSGASVSGADLRHADLREAALNDGDLRGTSLSGANLSGAFLSGVHHDGKTIVEGVTVDSSTVGIWW